MISRHRVNTAADGGDPLAGILRILLKWCDFVQFKVALNR
jgi:hypothetical protein